MILKPIIPPVILVIALALAVIGALYCIFNKRYRRSRNFIRICIFIAVIVALFRPILPKEGDIQTASSNAVIYFIVDSTGSMAAKDESERERIEVARDNMNSIIDSFVAPKVGIFVQDVITYQTLPITSDMGAAKQLVSSLLVKDVKSSEGSDIKALIKSASAHFKQYKNKNPEASMIVFILSDGESLGEDKGENELAKSDFKDAAYGAVIGYGSIEGAPVPNIKRKSGEIDYYQDTAQPFLKKNGETIISHKNDASLREIAGIYNFKYREPSDIDTIISEAKEKVNTPTIMDDTVNTTSAFETYWIFMLIAGILLLMEFYQDFNSILAEREVKK